MKRCMYCGFENDDSNQNCSKCGNQLLDTPPQQAVPTTEAEGAGQEMPQQPDQGSMPETSDIEQMVKQVENNRPEEPIWQNGVPVMQDNQQPGQPIEQQGRPMGQQYYQQPMPQVQQQYGGQAYGYEEPVQQFGYQGQPGQPGQMGNHNYGKMQQPTGGGRQTMLKARKMVKSPLFFFVTLFYTVMLVSSILNVVTQNVIAELNTMQLTAQNVMGNNVALSFVSNLVDLVEKSNLLIILGVYFLMALPGVFLCIGMWIMFGQTHRNDAPISTSGYTMVKVMVIIKFVLLCLALAAGLIISVAFVVAAGASSSAASIIVGIILLLIMIIISVLVIMFYVQLLFGLKAIKLNAKTGANPGRVPAFVPGIGIILFLLTALAMIPMAPDDYIGLTCQGATVAWMLFGSIWLLVYRAKIK